MERIHSADQGDEAASSPFKPSSSGKQQQQQQKQQDTATALEPRPIPCMLLPPDTLPTVDSLAAHLARLSTESSFSSTTAASAQLFACDPPDDSVTRSRWLGSVRVVSVCPRALYDPS